MLSDERLAEIRSFYVTPYETMKAPATVRLGFEAATDMLGEIERLRNENLELKKSREAADRIAAENEETDGRIISHLKQRLELIAARDAAMRTAIKDALDLLERRTRCGSLSESTVQEVCDDLRAFLPATQEPIDEPQ